MKPIPKRHHILPQHCYLRAFATADSSPENLQIWVHSFGKKPRKSSMVDAGVVGHFYTFYDTAGNKDTSLETFLATVEATLAPTVAKLVAQGDDIGFSVSERQSIANFVGMMIVRTPQYRQRMQSLLEILRKALDARSKGQDPVAIMRTVTNAPESTLSFASITDDQTRQFFGNETLQKNLHVLGLWSQAELHAKVLYEEMQWGFVKTPNSLEFITCDDPVARIDERRHLHKEGPANPDVVIYFPLSPSLCFYAYRDGMDILRMQGSPAIDATPEQVTIINERMILSAERDIYSKSENPNIETLMQGRMQQKL